MGIVVNGCKALGMLAMGFNLEDRFEKSVISLDENELVRIAYYDKESKSYGEWKPYSITVDEITKNDWTVKC